MKALLCFVLLAIAVGCHGFSVSESHVMEPAAAEVSVTRSAPSFVEENTQNLKEQIAAIVAEIQKHPDLKFTDPDVNGLSGAEVVDVHTAADHWRFAAKTPRVQGFTVDGGLGSMESKDRVHFAQDIPKRFAELCKLAKCTGNTVTTSLTEAQAKQLLKTDPAFRYMLKRFALTALPIEWVKSSNKFKALYSKDGLGKAIMEDFLAEPNVGGYKYTDGKTDIYRGAVCEFASEQDAKNAFESKVRPQDKTKMPYVIIEDYPDSALESGSYSPYVAAGYAMPSHNCIIIMTLKGVTQAVDIARMSQMQQEVLIPNLYYTIEGFQVKTVKEMNILKQGPFGDYKTYGTLKDNVKQLDNPYYTDKKNKDMMSTITFKQDTVLIELTLQPVDSEDATGRDVFEAVKKDKIGKEALSAFLMPKYNQAKFTDITKLYEDAKAKAQQKCGDKNYFWFKKKRNADRKVECEKANAVLSDLACPYYVVKSSENIAKYDGRLLDHVAKTSTDFGMINFLIANRRFEEEILAPKTMTYAGAVHAAKLCIALNEAKGYDVANMFKLNPKRYCGDIKVDNFDWKAETNLRVLMTACYHSSPALDDNALPPELVKKKNDPGVCRIFGNNALSTPPPSWAGLKGAIENNAVWPEMNKARIRAAFDAKRNDQTYLHESDLSQTPVSAAEKEHWGFKGDEDLTGKNLARFEGDEAADKGFDVGENNHIVFLSPRTTDGIQFDGLGFVAQSKRLGKLVFTGPSGTSQAVMEHALQVGFTEDELVMLKIGLLGWQLAVRDHSFHEISVALDGYGAQLNYPLPNVKPTEVYQNIIGTKKVVMRDPTNLAAAPKAQAYDRDHLNAHLGYKKGQHVCTPDYYLTKKATDADDCKLGTVLPYGAAAQAKEVKLAAGLKICHGGDNPPMAPLLFSDVSELCDKYMGEITPSLTNGASLKVLARPTWVRLKKEIKLHGYEGPVKQALDSAQGATHADKAAAIAADFCGKKGAFSAVTGFDGFVVPEAATIKSCEYLDVPEGKCTEGGHPDIKPTAVVLCKWEDAAVLVHRANQFVVKAGGGKKVGKLNVGAFAHLLGGKKDENI